MLFASDGVRKFLWAQLSVSSAAWVRNVGAVVKVAVGSAALQVLLNHVNHHLTCLWISSRSPHSRETSSRIFLNVIDEEKNEASENHLKQNEHHQADWVSFQEANVVLHGSAASDKRDDKDENSNSNHNRWNCIGKMIVGQYFPQLRNLRQCQSAMNYQHNTSNLKDNKTTCEQQVFREVITEAWRSPSVLANKVDYISITITW